MATSTHSATRFNAPTYQSDPSGLRVGAAVSEYISLGQANYVEGEIYNNDIAGFGSFILDSIPFIGDAAIDFVQGAAGLVFDFGIIARAQVGSLVTTGGFQNLNDIDTIGSFTKRLLQGEATVDDAIAGAVTVIGVGATAVFGVPAAIFAGVVVSAGQLLGGFINNDPRAGGAALFGLALSAAPYARPAAQAVRGRFVSTAKVQSASPALKASGGATPGGKTVGGTGSANQPTVGSAAADTLAASDVVPQSAVGVSSGVKPVSVNGQAASKTTAASNGSTRGGVGQSSTGTSGSNPAASNATQSAGRATRPANTSTRPGSSNPKNSRIPTTAEIRATPGYSQLVRNPAASARGFRQNPNSSAGRIGNNPLPSTPGNAVITSIDDLVPGASRPGAAAAASRQLPVDRLGRALQTLDGITDSQVGLIRARVRQLGRAGDDFVPQARVLADELASLGRSPWRISESQIGTEITRLVGQSRAGALFRQLDQLELLSPFLRGTPSSGAASLAGPGAAARAAARAFVPQGRSINLSGVARQAQRIADRTREITQNFLRRNPSQGTGRLNGADVERFGEAFTIAKLGTGQKFLFLTDDLLEIEQHIANFLDQAKRGLRTPGDDLDTIVVHNRLATGEFTYNVGGVRRTISPVQVSDAAVALGFRRGNIALRSCLSGCPSPDGSIIAQRFIQAFSDTLELGPNRASATAPRGAVLANGEIGATVTDAAGVIDYVARPTTLADFTVARPSLLKAFGSNEVYGISSPSRPAPPAEMLLEIGDDFINAQFSSLNHELIGVPEFVQFVWRDLPDGQLGQGLWLPQSDADPVFEIAIDTDASGRGWYIDDHFSDGTTLESVIWTDEPDAISDGKTYDLATVIGHELGHALGFGSAYVSFVESTSEIDGELIYTSAAGQTFALDSTGSELDPDQYPEALMAATLRPGEQKSLTPVDREIFIDIFRGDHSTAGRETTAFLHTDEHGAPHGGFTILAGHVADDLRSGPAIGLQNATFARDDPSTNDFAWRTVGDVAVADGIATISEDVGMISDLSQTFVIPQGVNTLTFTLGGLSLDVGQGEHPVEAFEVSLLDAVSATSLLGEMDGMGGGDALLNVQAGGEVFFADSVTASEISSSGDSIDLSSQSIDVTVAIPSDAAGKTATLYFDLIGFGDDDSSAEVSGIELETLEVESGWQNPRDRFDVNDIGGVTANDALIIINQLATPRVHDPETGLLDEITDTVGPAPYYDVTGDGKVTALDALHVMNFIARQGESEQRTWQNPVDRFDVNDRDGATELDALLIINELAAARVHDRESGQLDQITDDVGPPPFFDVNGDGRISELDALQVMNQIRVQRAEPEVFDAALEEFDLDSDEV